MRQQHQVIEEKGPDAPAYLVTFGALVVLLMLFFVMLLSLASTQDAGLFGQGQGAFVQSLKSFGLGTFPGAMEKLNFSYAKRKYFISNPDKSFKGRSIDAREEEIRRIFKNVSRFGKTMPSQIVAKTTNFSATNITFPPDDVTLNEPAKKFLTQFALDLQQYVGPKTVKLYVLGLAHNEQPERKQWILSAKRAQAVADFLNEILPSELQCPVYSWGAGPGGHWAAEDSLISKQSQILIAVLRGNE